MPLDSAPAHSASYRRRRFLNWFPMGLTYAFLYMGRYNLTVAKNAALLAVSILALKDKTLAGRLTEYRSAMKKEVLAKSRKAAKLGYKKYLEIMIK